MDFFFFLPVKKWLLLKSKKITVEIEKIHGNRTFFKQNQKKSEKMEKFFTNGKHSQKIEQKMHG